MKRPFFLIALVVLGLLMSPWLETPLHTVRLALTPAPQTLRVPVANVDRRSLHDTWGATRSGGRRHKGIDIFAPRGTPVLAATDGVVWSTRGNALGGTVAWVFGPSAQFHYYAHLDTLAVESGARVRAGQTIGTVGNTGNARTTPPHLHYAVYTARGPLNPYPLLRSPGGGAPSD